MITKVRYNPNAVGMGKTKRDIVQTFCKTHLNADVAALEASLGAKYEVIEHVVGANVPDMVINKVP